MQDYNFARDRERHTNVKAPTRLGFEDMVSFALNITSEDPTNFQGAITSQDKENWMGAMVEEMESLQSAIYLAKNQIYHARTKHIDVRSHKIRDLIAFGEILLQKIGTAENAVDMLTKSVTTDKFKYCLDLLNVYSC